MKLTKKSCYALNIISEMVAYPDTLISSKRVADKYNLKIAFVFIIFGELRKAGLVIPKKGPGGGYSLKRNPSGITPHDILSAVSEKLDQKIILDESSNTTCRNFVSSLENSLIKFLKTPLIDFKENTDGV